MQDESLQEARRQLEICNACRYCESYCSVFPAVHAVHAFSDGDLTQFANLCHNCRGCYYACQYTPPHGFALNLPNALAELRQDSWEEFAAPRVVGRLFQRNGLLLATATALCLALLLGLIRLAGDGGGEGFYAALPHTLMAGIFMLASLFPLLSLTVSLRRYWRATEGEWIRGSQLLAALKSAATAHNLDGGHGEGCNFEDEDRYSRARLFAHQLVMYGFMLCFAATAAGTVMHYLLDKPAPYPLWSAPKVFGISGGLALSAGSAWMVLLKLRADKTLAAPSAWGGEIEFIALLGAMALTGLLLFVLGSTAAMPTLLAVHLGTVLTFFLLTPFSKMAHAFYRLAALIRDEQCKQQR